MSDKAKPAYSDAPDAWPDRDENPHSGGGTNDGVQMPPFIHPPGTDAPPTAG